MVESLSFLTEKQVINLCDGKVIGYITDFKVDTCCGRIVDIILPGDRGIFCKRFTDIVIPWEKICKIGEDAIIVDIGDIMNGCEDKKKNKHKFSCQ